MSTSWKNFWGIILIFAGLQLNLTERLYVIAVNEPLETLLFVFLMAVAVAGVVCKKELINQLALMAIILILVGYLGTKFPIDGIIEKIPLLAKRVISIVFIAIGVLILNNTAQILWSDIKTKIRDRIAKRKNKKAKKKKS